ncbi:unnamed protein product [Urochloa humidicola]
MAENRNHGNTWWAAGAGFGFLTLNSGLAIYRAKGDPASILFVAGTYLTLLLLFRCLREYKRALPGSSERERARRAVWPLPTVLTLAFAWKVAAVMPWAVAVAVVWALAVATTTGGFFALLPFVTVSYLALVLLFVCLVRAYEEAPAGSPARERAAALMMVAFGAMACDAALSIHDAFGSNMMGSTTFVLVAYAALLALTFRFLHAFAGQS